MPSWSPPLPATIITKEPLIIYSQASPVFYAGQNIGVLPGLNFLVAPSPANLSQGGRNGRILTQLRHSFYFSEKFAGEKHLAIRVIRHDAINFCYMPPERFSRVILHRNMVLHCMITPAGHAPAPPVQVSSARPEMKATITPNARKLKKSASSRPFPAVAAPRLRKPQRFRNLILGEADKRCATLNWIFLKYGAAKTLSGVRSSKNKF